MDIIDCHCHIFPDNLAKRASESIGSFYGLSMEPNAGTCDDLMKRAEKYNISRMIVHSTAIKPGQVESINTFIGDSISKYPAFIGFGTLHPDYEPLEKEYERIKSLGLKGIKIHSDFQQINMDDKKMDAVYELIGDEMPILFHVGDKTKDFSHPRRLKNVIDRFPKLKAIAAHMGGYSKWDEALLLLGGREVYFDTSSSFPFLDDAQIIHILNTHGTDKILFGSDYPMWDVGDEYNRLLSFKLDDNSMERILNKNIKCLLSL